MDHYPHHPLRRSLVLDGTWDFAWLGAVDPAAVDPAAPCDEAAAVPGTFDSGSRRNGVRGVGLYRRTVRLPVPAGSRLRLHLDGLGLRARVWWDGQPVATCELPYSGEAIDLRADSRTVHQLAIAVDNRFDAELSPLFPPFSDFYAYGGIYRSVRLEVLPELTVARVRVTTLDLATARVRLELRLEGTAPAVLPLSLAFDDGVAESLSVQPRDGVVVLERRLPGARPWSPDHPELHTVRVAIADDEVVERFGLRTIAARDGRILLNGQPLRLRGVNRHEAHPQFGPVQPRALILDDLHLIKDLGCNFVRAVHYPMDPAFHDLCDRLGLLVWEESLGWGLGEEVLCQPRAAAQAVEQTRRMVAQGVNHPAVIMWGFLNESASDKASAVPLYSALASAVRAEDPTRLVTYASNRMEHDLCFALADVVSVNPYPGWIWPLGDWNTPSLSVIRPHLLQLAGRLAALPGAVGKPLLVSEIGACALYGCHDRGRAQWSEEFQADFMVEACRAVLDDPRWSGVTLWQFSDSRSFVGVGQIRTKPRGYNCAGLVDEFRRPKLAYDAVRAAWAIRATVGEEGCHTYRKQV